MISNCANRIWACLLAVSAGGFASLGALSVAAEDASADQTVEEVVVIGTRRSERSASDLAVPVDVISEQDLQAQGSSDMLDILTSVIPSYNVGREPISDVATLVRPANLRGLSADSTLILVNGKRRHKGATVGEFVSGINKGAQAVDITPLAGIAMKQVEVLRDGAAAQYGSDAIAGVMNFVLSDDPEARRLQIQYGSAYEGDGETVAVSGLFGTHLGRDGFATLGFEIKDTDSTSRGSQDPQALAVVAAGVNATEVANPVVEWGQPNVWNDYKLLFNAAVEAGDSEVYGHAIVSSRKVDGSFFYRNPFTRGAVFQSDGNLHIYDLDTTDAVTCPTISNTDANGDADWGTALTALNAAIAGPTWAGNCFSYTEWFPGGFTPRFGGKVNDTTVVGGIRGEWNNGMTYDVSVSSGRNEVVFEISNTVNASYGPNSPTSFDLGAQIQTERVVNADFTKGLEVGLQSDLNLAWGLQYHEEEFEMVAGQTESWANGGFANNGSLAHHGSGSSVGANGFQGFSTDVSGKFDRQSHAAYLDLEADVTDRWLVAGALRFEDFSDFGSTSKGKLATRFAVTDSFNLRGSVSTGFRAPSMGQTNLQRASTGFSGGQLQESLTVAATNPIAAQKGARPLQPEESLSFTLGAAFSIGDLDLTIDWFKIEVDDRIALTQQIELTAADKAALQAQGIIGVNTVSTVQFFTNDFDSETSGLDIVANYPFQWAGGNANMTFAYNYTDTEITQLGTIITGGDAVRDREDVVPQDRASFTLANDWDRLSGLVRVNYYGEVFELLYGCCDPIETDEAVYVVDAELTYNMSDVYSITVGAKNLFDSYPPKHQVAGVNGYLGADYPLNHPAGFGGGVYYLRFGADF